MDPPEITVTFLIAGGGIAGISCLETLRHLCPEATIALLTESALIKTVTNLVPLGKALTRFDVTEQPASQLATEGVRIIQGDRLCRINSADHIAITARGVRIRYAQLCLCTGARPALIAQAAEYPELIVGIRDTESVAQFQRRIHGSRRIAIVGNGGIAAECAYAVRNVHVDWVIKDQFVAQTFVDPGAAEFFRQRIEQKGEGTVDDGKPGAKGPVKRMRYGETSDGSEGGGKSGAALGPDWHRQWDLSAATSEGQTVDQSVTVHTNCEIQSIEATAAPFDHPLFLHLTNGTRLPSDLIVSATGVRPAIDFTCTDAELTISADDGGILVDHLQRTAVADIYAAGDVCTANWRPLSAHWHQMRLWTQARQMGSMAGRAMAAQLQGVPSNEVLQDFCFELFGHVTQLFGHQVVLLGKFNGQGLGRDYEALIRTTPGQEYIKYVLKDGRVQGAILIGETGLEETTENLILNELDVSGYGEGLLDPNVDIEDYFD